MYNCQWYSGMEPTYIELRTSGFLCSLGYWGYTAHSESTRGLLALTSGMREVEVITPISYRYFLYCRQQNLGSSTGYGHSYHTEAYEYSKTGTQIRDPVNELCYSIHFTIMWCTSHLVFLVGKEWGLSARIFLETLELSGHYLINRTSNNSCYTPCTKSALFQLTKTKTKKHFSKAYLLVIKTKTIIIWSQSIN